jgi:hypothetical protein
MKNGVFWDVTTTTRRNIPEDAILHLRNGLWDRYKTTLIYFYEICFFLTEEHDKKSEVEWHILLNASHKQTCQMICETQEEAVWRQQCLTEVCDVDFPTKSIKRYFSRSTRVLEIYKAFKLPYIRNYVTKLCRHQAEVIQNHRNAIVCNIGQSEDPHRKYKRLILGDSEVHDRSSVPTAVVAWATYDGA